MALQDVPMPASTLANTQAPIRLNFTNINAAFLQDHQEIVLANQGKHKKVTFLEQAAAPVTLATELALFTRDSGGVPELCLKRENNGRVVEYSTYNNGWTRLPSGIIIKFLQSAGTLVNGVGLGNNTMIYPVAPNNPVFTHVYCGFVTLFGGASAGSPICVINTVNTTETILSCTDMTGSGNRAYLLVLGDDF